MRWRVNFAHRLPLNRRKLMASVGVISAQMERLFQARRLMDISRAVSPLDPNEVTTLFLVITGALQNRRNSILLSCQG